MTKDPYKYFVPEARELAEQLGQGVLDLEKGRGGPPLVQRLLRAAHTLKGAARVVKQREVADSAHAIEEELAPFRDSIAELPADRIETLLRLIDEIGDRVSALEPSPLPTPSTPDGGAVPAPRAASDMDAVLDGIAETRTQLHALRGATRTLARVRDLTDLLSRQLASRATRQGDTAPTGNVHAMARDCRQLIRDLERQLAIGLEHADRELGQLRETAEQMRLVPAANMFVALERTARDAAQALKKQVRFEGTGGDVRMEAHVLAAVQQASVQLVRNAVAHGIERESARRSLGKSAIGQVTVDVARRDRRIVIRVRDDGGGVDLEAVRRAAERRGSSEAEVGKLGAQELMRLLLRGGMSTSADVTEVAGRGIGLDLVREVVDRLGGEVSVASEPGTGTTFELIVPVILASVETLVVENDGMLMAIPLDSVRETRRLSSADVSRSADGESIVHGGRMIPFVPISRALRRDLSATRAARMQSTVIVEGANGLAAIAVDRCVGTERVMVRPLPALASADAVVAGMHLDSDSNPRLVLDADALVREAARASAVPASPEPERPLPLLVVDDSLTTRMLEQSILESAGYEVDAVTSAEEALARARQKPYALFLVDVEMPGMDGFTFVEHVRADVALREVPAILITSRNSPEDLRRGQDVGAQGYIVKGDFNQADLLARIRRLVA